MPGPLDEVEVRAFSASSEAGGEGVVSVTASAWIGSVVTTVGTVMMYSAATGAESQSVTTGKNSKDRKHVSIVY
jgi:hypothetical protein